MSKQQRHTTIFLADALLEFARLRIRDCKCAVLGSPVHDADGRRELLATKIVLHGERMLTKGKLTTVRKRFSDRHRSVIGILSFPNSEQVSFQASERATVVIVQDGRVREILPIGIGRYTQEE